MRQILEPRVEKGRRAITLVLATVALAMSPACGGGGRSPTESREQVSFTADRAAAANSVFLRRGSGSSGTSFHLEVVAENVQGFYTVTTVVSYPANLLRYERSVQGPFLAAGDAPLLVVNPVPGFGSSLLVFDTRVLSASGVSGSGVILTLQFTALANGTGRIDLDGPEATNAADQPIPGVSWISGTVRVDR